MIIELSTEFDSISVSEWRKYQPAIENLIVAHKDGHHIFVPSRKAAEAIVAHCSLSGTQKEFFNSYICNKFSTISGLARSAKKKVVALADIDSSTNRSCDKSIYIRLRAFENAELCQPASILVENADTDGKFIDIICDIVSKDLSVGNTYRYTKVHGGGSSLAAIYKNHCCTHKAVICIVDSDKVSPKSRLGDTASAVMSCSTMDNILSQTILLPVREMENFIPLDFAIELYSDSPNVKRIIYKYKKILDLDVSGDKLPPNSFFGYMDLKKGFRRSDIKKADEDDKIFMNKIIHEIGFRDIQSKSESDADIILEGVSENLLPNLLNNIEENGYLRKSFSLHLKASPFYKDILDIVERILCISAALGRVPVKLG